MWDTDPGLRELLAEDARLLAEARALWGGAVEPEVGYEIERLEGQRRQVWDKIRARKALLRTGPA